MTAALNVGVVGAGHVVANSHLPELMSRNDVKVAWICDVDVAKAKSLCKAFGIAQWCDSVMGTPPAEAILLAVPVGRRRPVWECVFGNKWHVLCEKPLAVSWLEYQEIVSKAKPLGLVLHTGLVRRFFHSTLLMKRLVEEEVFGRPEEIWAAEGGPARNTGRDATWYQGNKELAGGGILMETGSHLVDQVLFVSGAGDYTFEDAKLRTIADGIDVDVEIRCVLERNSYAVPTTISLSCIRDLCCGIYFRFERNTVCLELGPPDSPVKLLDLHGAVKCDLSHRSLGAANSVQAAHLQWNAFLEDCRAKERRPTPFEDASSSVKLIDESYRQGTKVR